MKYMRMIQSHDRLIMGVSICNEYFLGSLRGLTDLRSGITTFFLCAVN